MKRYITYLRNFHKYSYLLYLLVKKDVKKKYKGSFLGILWSLLNPLLHMIILTLVFSTLFGTDIDNFPVYMLCGFLIFNFFSSSTVSAMNSIIHSSSILSKVYIPKYIVTLSTIISNFVFFSISLIDLVIVMICTGYKASINILFMPVYLILLFIFCCGLSLLLATITVFFRDMEHIYGVIIMALNFTSAIFYPASIIPEKFKFILSVNPIYHYIEGFREVIYYNQSPDIVNLVTCLLIAVFSLVFGIVVFERNQDKFILHL